MPEIDPVILQLRADLDKYNRDLFNTTRNVDKLLGRQAASARRLEAQMRKSSTAMSGSLKALAGSFATYFTGRELVGVLDSFTRLQNNLRVAGQEGQNLARVQNNLLGISQKYGVSIEALSNVFLKASLAQKDLGASTEQMIELNEIVAASLKITGTSTEEARGALLQLGQALGGNIVRAEEFNSLLENALPILQAAARGIDGMEGSVAKLRNAVTEGEVTSREFFEGVLKGGNQTLADAEKATLTLAGGFEALTSTITVYFGEADKANGVSAALGEALKTIADNIDTIIPALATVATFFGVKWVAGMAGATAATIATSNAVFGLRAALLGAATAGEALKFALAGSGFGLALAAITALGGAVYYFSTRTDDAAESVDGLNESLSASERFQQQLNNTMNNDQSARVAGDVRKLAQAHRDAAKAAYEQAAAQLVLQRSQAKSELDLARKGLRKKTEPIFGAPTRGGRGPRKVIGERTTFEQIRKPAPKGIGRAAPDRQAEAVRSAETRIAELDIELDDLRLTYEAAIAAGPSGGGGSGGSGSTSKSKKSKKKGRDPDTIAAQYNDELDRLEQQILQSKAQRATSAEQASELESQSVRLAELGAIASIEADADYNDAQKARLVEAVKRLAAEEQRTIEFEKTRRLEAEAQELLSQQYENKRGELEVQASLADTQDERKTIALEMLDLEHKYQEQLLEAVLYSETATEAEKERAQLALDNLRRLKGERAKAVARQNETDVERYIRGLNKTPEQINEAMDRIKIDGLDALNDGLVDAITGVRSLGDVFKSVADQIIADLLRIAIQQAVIKPLANAIFGGVTSLFGGSFGQNLGTAPSYGFAASGGYVQPGRWYEVNEGAGQRGRVEGFMSRDGGTIIPLGQMNSLVQQRGEGGMAVVRLELSGDIDARIQQVSGPVAVEVVKSAVPVLVDRSAREAISRARRPSL